jgi:hypothetical protein
MNNNPSFRITTFVVSTMVFGTTWVSLSKVGLSQNAKPSVIVQGYKIVVEDLQRTDVMKMETELNPLRALNGQDMEQFMKALQQAANGGIPNGDADQVPPPNLGLALQIESGAKNRPRNNSLVEIVSPLAATDDQGQRFDSPDNPSLEIHFPQFENDKKDARFFYFYQKDRNSKTIAKLEGELLVTPGRIVSVEFKGPKWVNQMKRLGRDTFTITALDQNNKEMIVTMSLPMQQKPMPDFNNPQAFQAAMMESFDAFRLEVEDDQGKTYKPRNYFLGNGSAMNQMNSNFSFQFGGGFNNQAGNIQKPQSSNTRIFNLPPLPPDRQIKAIRVTMTEKMGDSRKLPFVIQDIPLP